MEDDDELLEDESEEELDDELDDESDDELDDEDDELSLLEEPFSCHKSVNTVLLAIYGSLYRRLIYSTREHTVSIQVVSQSGNRPGQGEVRVSGHSSIAIYLYPGRCSPVIRL